MFICLTTYLQPLDRSDPVVARHGAYLDECYNSGQLVCSGPQNSGTGGALVIRTSDADEADTVMRNDPLVVEGCVSYQLIPFTATRAAFPTLVDERR